MPVSDDVVERARRGDLDCCQALLAGSYPSVVRMARALTGDEASAQHVTDFVLTRGIRVLPKWRRGTTPENWFYHHTLLAARDRAAARPPPEPVDDPLAARARAADAAALEPGYLAFVRAVRTLPPQQREAFILHHGERLNPRLLGVAMDCSAGAAENHLAAATTALSAVVGPSLGPYAAALSRGYLALGPPAADAGMAVRRYAVGYVRPLRLRRLLRRVVWVVVVVALAWAGLYWRHEWVAWVSLWVERLRGSAGG